MRHFRRPLIVTGIVFAAAMVVAAIGLVWIYNSPGSGSQKEARAGMLGTGMGTLVPIVLAPFWIYAAAQFGKERRGELRPPERGEKPKPPARRRPLPPPGKGR